MAGKKKQVKKTRRVQKTNPKTGQPEWVTETYYEPVSDTGSYGDYCGAGGNDSGGFGSCD